MRNGASRSRPLSSWWTGSPRATGWPRSWSPSARNGWAATSAHGRSTSGTSSRVPTVASSTSAFCARSTGPPPSATSDAGRSGSRRHALGMDFGFGEDQELLRTTTRRFLTEHQSLAKIRRSLEEPELFDAGIWRQGADLGWAAMLVPAEYEGGSVTDQPLVDLIVLAEEIGRELNPGPFLPSNVVADAIARLGTDVQGKEHLPRIARGESTCAWCLSGDGSPEPSAVEVRAARVVGGGWELDGVARYVHGAGDAGR